MSQDNPKITFVYPTFLQAGMMATGPFTPDIGWRISTSPETMTFYVSIGLLLNHKRPYSFDIDVLFSGKSLTPDDAPQIESKLIRTAVSSQDDFIAISTNLLENVVMPGSGVYTIKARLFAGEANSDEKHLIDEHFGYFTLAEDWMANEMRRVE